MKTKGEGPCNMPLPLLLQVLQLLLVTPTAAHHTHSYHLLCLFKPPGTCPYPALLSHPLVLIYTTPCAHLNPGTIIPPALSCPCSCLPLPPAFIRTPLPLFAFEVVAVGATVVRPCCCCCLLSPASGHPTIHSPSTHHSPSIICCHLSFTAHVHLPALVLMLHPYSCPWFVSV